MNRKQPQTSERIARRRQEMSLLQDLSTLAIEYEKYLIEFAKAEAKYHAAKRSRVLEMQSQGMTATNINNIIKGDPKVNKLLLEKNIAEAYLKARLEMINIKKLTIRSLGLEYD